MQIMIDHQVLYSVPPWASASRDKHLQLQGLEMAIVLEKAMICHSVTEGDDQAEYLKLSMEFYKASHLVGHRKPNLCFYFT